MRHLPCLLLALAATACIRDTRPSRERGAAALFDRAPDVRGPEKDRCQALGKSSVRQSCEEARYLGQLYARRLAPGDDVCLEGGVGEAPGASCQARASVVDSDNDRVLLEIREARPESRWFKRVQSQAWFHEGALVDLYLAEQGY